MQDKTQITATHQQVTTGHDQEFREELGKTCMDGGTCHHKEICTERCFRRECCQPLTQAMNAGLTMQQWRYPHANQLHELESIAQRYAHEFENAGRETYGEDAEKAARKAKTKLTAALTEFLGKIAAPQAAPAAVAALLEALESIVDVCEGHDFDGAPSDAHMEKARAAITTYRAALAATPAAAAPVVPPEPDAVLRVVVDGDTPSVISFNTLTNGEYGVFYASTVRALLATATGLPAQEVELPTVELIGIKDGKETSLGQVPMPPTMKARELLRDVGFSGLDDDDGDGAYAMGACEQLIEYCKSYFSPQAQAYAREFPAMTPELASILGLMCFQCIPFAQALRTAGHQIKTRAEDEQAAVLHWMLGHWFRHGEEWRDHAQADMNRMKDAAVAASKGE